MNLIDAYLEGMKDATDCLIKAVERHPWTYGKKTLIDVMKVTLGSI